MNPNNWTPKQLILASVVVSVLSAAVSAGIILWVVAPAKTAEPVVFQAVHSAVPTPAGDPLSRANAFYDRQQWAEAIAGYREVIASGRDDPNIRTDLGNCYRFTNSPQQALEEYQLAQKMDPNHEQSLYNQITLFAETLHEHERAKAQASEFERRFPQSESLSKVRELVAEKK